MNDNYYSLLCREELVEKHGGAHLPLRTEPLASAAQFHEMSPGGEGKEGGRGKEEEDKEEESLLIQSCRALRPKLKRRPPIRRAIHVHSEMIESWVGGAGDNMDRWYL